MPDNPPDSSQYQQIPPNPWGRHTKHHFQSRETGEMLSATPFTPIDEQVASSSITARKLAQRESALAKMPDM